MLGNKKYFLKIFIFGLVVALAGFKPLSKV